MLAIIVVCLSLFRKSA